MSSYTTNLNLLKKDPEADGNDYFNIQTMLNDNWDKIDAGKKMQDDAIAAHEAETAAHGAASAATASKIIVRDANGRAKVAAPSAADDIARKDTVDAVQTNLTTHTGAVAPHSGHIAHSLAAAANDMLVASAAGSFVKKTLAEVKAILGLGSLAYLSTTPVANGGTGATTAAQALANLGITATAAEVNILDGVTGVTAAEITYLANVTSDIQAQLDAKALKAPDMVTNTASKTLALTDAGKVQFCNNTTAITITIPTNASVALPLYTEIGLIRWNTGTVTIAPASGVTLHSSGEKRSIKNQYETAALKQVAANVWELVGSLSA